MCATQLPNLPPSLLQFVVKSIYTASHVRQQQHTSIALSVLQHQKRWRFSDLVERARRLQPRRERTPGGMTATELMVMMPMDIIAVGEVSDGVESTVIHLASHNSKVLDAQLKALRDEGVAGDA